MSHDGNSEHLIEVPPATINVTDASELRQLRDENKMLRLELQRQQQLQKRKQAMPIVDTIAEVETPPSSPAGKSSGAQNALCQPSAGDDESEPLVSPPPATKSINVSVLARTTVSMKVSSEMEETLQLLVDERRKQVNS